MDTSLRYSPSAHYPYLLQVAKSITNSIWPTFPQKIDRYRWDTASRNTASSFLLNPLKIQTVTKSLPYIISFQVQDKDEQDRPHGGLKICSQKKHLWRTLCPLQGQAWKQRGILMQNANEESLWSNKRILVPIRISNIVYIFDCITASLKKKWANDPCVHLTK